MNPVVVCPACDGRGYVMSAPPVRAINCGACSGTGEVSEEQVLDPGAES